MNLGPSATTSGVPDAHITAMNISYPPRGVWFVHGRDIHDYPLFISDDEFPEPRRVFRGDSKRNE